MLEKTVPNNKNSIRGSVLQILFTENSIQIVVITNIPINGRSGRNASLIDRIFPVSFL